MYININIYICVCVYLYGTHRQNRRTNNVDTE